MKENLEKGIKFVLRWEGGYSNDPADPGGETKYGICKRDHPGLDIKNLTTKQAAEIYRAKYWSPAGCDELPAPIDLIVFDGAVNCGVKTSRQWAAQFKESDELLARRVLYYLRVIKNKPKLKKFLTGWLNRVADLAKETL